MVRILEAIEEVVSCFVQLESGEYRNLLKSRESASTFVQSCPVLESLNWGSSMTCRRPANVASPTRSWISKIFGIWLSLRMPHTLVFRRISIAYRPEEMAAALRPLENKALASSNRSFHASASSLADALNDLNLSSWPIIPLPAASDASRSPARRPGRCAAICPRRRPGPGVAGRSAGWTPSGRREYSGRECRPGWP